MRVAFIQAVETPKNCPWMPENPYAPSSSTIETGRHRSVLRYSFSAGVLFAIAIVVSAPGSALLNRRLTRPTRRYATYDPEFALFGRSVSEATIMSCSLGLGALVLVAAIAMLTLALRIRYPARRLAE